MQDQAIVPVAEDQSAAGTVQDDRVRVERRAAYVAPGVLRRRGRGDVGEQLAAGIRMPVCVGKLLFRRYKEDGH
jgi:hypothetical protein